MSHGYIRLWRALDNNRDFQADPILLLVFIKLLMKANRNESEFVVDGRKVRFPPGSLCFSLRTLAAELKMDKMTLKRKLDTLQVRDTVDTVRDTRGYVVTIRNWSVYQHTEKQDETPDVTELSSNPPPTRIKKEKKEERESPGGDLHPLIQIWNQHRGGLPEVKASNAQRNRKAEAVWRQNPTTEYWAEIVTRLARSPFCTGQNDRGWRANFDFLLRPGTHLKVSEGAYDRAASGAAAVNLTPKRLA
jgi:DNA-binding transcriptional MocR family regulator